MKRIGILLIWLVVFNTKHINAQVFNLQKNENYMYKLSWQHQNTTKTMIITMYKVYDEDGEVFYNVEPEVTMFERMEYNKDDLKLNLEVYNKINKIIYFGYGFENNISDKYYFATQYLIFNELGLSEVKIVDINHNESDYAAKEISEIKKRIDEYEFKIEDYHTIDSKIKITDSYIIDNFEIEGDNIAVDVNNGIYEVNLLGNEERYKINFKSKNKCLPANYWSSDIAPDLISTTYLCEESKVVNVYRDIKDIDTNEEENNIDLTIKNDDYVVVEKEEVFVPNTSKYSLNWLIILLISGNIYYVFKK